MPAPALDEALALAPPPALLPLPLAAARAPLVPCLVGTAPPFEVAEVVEDEWGTGACCWEVGTPMAEYSTGAAAAAPELAPADACEEPPVGEEADSVRAAAVAGAVAHVPPVARAGARAAAAQSASSSAAAAAARRGRAWERMVVWGLVLDELWG
jgi:hypothetical protein